MTRGYNSYFESWHPAETTLQEELVDSIKTMFVEQTLDSRIEAALPVLAKLQQENKMKEIDVFESWANRLTEGTWSLPETPEQQQRLEELMSRELIVGPDATNATAQLSDLIGDDELFDRLSELARRDASANVWDDSDIQERLAELGIQTPAMGEPTVEPDDENTQPVREGRVKELIMDLEDELMSDEEFETKYDGTRSDIRAQMAADEQAVGEGFNPDGSYNTSDDEANEFDDEQEVDESKSCNLTMEGEMCPAHGLAECSMHEDQVAESRAGDAMLARIKSLALIR